MSRWIKTSLVVGLFLMYPTVIKSLLQALNCVEIDGTLYLQEDYSIECFTGTHSDYVFATYFFLALYGLGIPLGSLLNLSIPSQIIFSKYCKFIKILIY